MKYKYPSLREVISAPEIWEVEPREVGWMFKDRCVCESVEPDELRIISENEIQIVISLTYDLVEGNYYAVRGDYYYPDSDILYYKCINNELIGVARDPKDNHTYNIATYNNELEKENKCLKAELDDIYKNLKIKKEEENI